MAVVYKQVYLYNMLYSKRRELCDILDSDGKWETLAINIGLTVDKVSRYALQLRRDHGSPSDMMLSDLGHLNWTTEMLLFYMLRSPELRRAAEVLRGTVPDAAFGNNMAGPPITSPASFQPPQFPVVSASALPTPKLEPKSPSLQPAAAKVGSNSSGSNQLDKTVYCQKCDAHVNIAMQPAISQGLTSPYFYYTQSTNMTSASPPSSAGYKMQPLPTAAAEKLSPGSPINAAMCVTMAAEMPEPARHHPTAIESVEDPTMTLTRFSNPAATLKATAPAVLVPIATVMQYQYEDILRTTRNFSEENVIGHGGFGVVYRCTLKNTQLAVKRLHELKETSSSYLAEISALQKYRHKNIITLYGCSVDGPHVCFVYEYMTNGSLLDRLECRNNTAPLDAPVRLSILRDVSSGLQYLHAVESGPMIHRNIKSTNIVLGEHFEAKISDFGLAKEATGGSLRTGPKTHVTRDQLADVYGSKAYLPLDIQINGGQYNVKTDVYSYGVVMLETCTGLKVYDPRRKDHEKLVDYINEALATGAVNKLVDLADSRAGHWSEAIFSQLISISRKCTSTLKKDRPPMVEVHSQLEQLVSNSPQVSRRSELNNQGMAPQSGVNTQNPAMMVPPGGDKQTPNHNNGYPYLSYDSSKVGFIRQPPASSIKKPSIANVTRMETTLTTIPHVTQTATTTTIVPCSNLLPPSIKEEHHQTCAECEISESPESSQSNLLSLSTGDRDEDYVAESFGSLQSEEEEGDTHLVCLGSNERFGDCCFRQGDSDEIKFENADELAATRWSRVEHHPTTTTNMENDFSQIVGLTTALNTTEHYGDNEDDSYRLLLQKKEKPFPDFFQGILNGEDYAGGAVAAVSETKPSPTLMQLLQAGGSSSRSGGLVAGQGFPSTADAGKLLALLPLPAEGMSKSPARERKIVGPPSLMKEDMERLAKLEFLKASHNRET